MSFLNNRDKVFSPWLISILVAILLDLGMGELDFHSFLAGGAVNALKY
jgi:hypothetical protein